MPTQNSAYSDEEIILAIQEGGTRRRQFEDILFQQFVHLVWKRPKKYGLTEQEAGDAYADAVIALIRQLVTHKFRRDSSLYTYLRNIFWNKCVDFSRKKTSIGVMEYEFPDIEDESKDFFRQFLKKEELDRVMGMLTRLGERCKKILLYAGQGYSATEIAKMMEFVSAESATSQKYQCKQKLLNLMNA